MMTGTMMTAAKSPGCWRSASALLALLYALAAALPAVGQTPVNPLRSVLSDVSQARKDTAWEEIESGRCSTYVPAMEVIESMYPPEQIVGAASTAATATIAASAIEPLPERSADISSEVARNWNESNALAPWESGAPHPAPPGAMGLHAPPGAIGPHDLFVQPWFTHTDPNDPFRHQGVGRPLVGTSWLNRPVFVGVFLGGLLADDLISTLCLASEAPVAIAPAMNHRMWGHPATQANVATLRSRGVRFFGPGEGRMAEPESGPGRLLEPHELVAALAGAGA